MRKASLSTLGKIMNILNIRTSDMASALHVDSSLISKWRTGARKFTKDSLYFDDMIRYISDSFEGDEQELLHILHDFLPQDFKNQPPNKSELISCALSTSYTSVFSKEQELVFGDHKTVPILSLGGVIGRQDGIRCVLDHADALGADKDLIIIDSEEFNWLLADNTYLEYFKKCILDLLDVGFNAKIVLHYSPSSENFRHFFELCSAILFNRSAEWYYSEYYDESVMNVSILTVNQSAMVFGMSVKDSESSTFVFTDKPSIERYGSMIHHIISRCTPIFYDFEPYELLNVIDTVPTFRKSTPLYSFLPVPAFIAIRPSLLKLILADNTLDAETTQKVLQLNRDFRLVTKSYNPKLGNSKDSFVQIFQLEKLIERVKMRSFISNSLTNICGKKIFITAEHHALALRHLADTLMANDNVSIVIASEKDYVFMPQINCWVKENSYILQMDKTGFRFSSESIAVSAASAALANCVRRVPPERKEKASVIKILLELADELEKAAKD